MHFKKIKHDLEVYYQSRASDNNLNIIRNTENQLALLAAEVITIFDLVKDQKLERRKNINESYLKRKSILNHILEEEVVKNQKKTTFQIQMQRIQTEKGVPHILLTPSKKNYYED